MGANFTAPPAVRRESGPRSTDFFCESAPDFTLRNSSKSVKYSGSTFNSLRFLKKYSPLLVRTLHDPSKGLTSVTVAATTLRPEVSSANTFKPTERGNLSGNFRLLSGS